MGPLSKIWEEVNDLNLNKTKCSINVEELKELIEKTILMIGQISVACLFEHRLNYLAKTMQSANLAWQALKAMKTQKRESGNSMDPNFTPSLKVKTRKRAMKISKNMEPPAKRPFRSVSSRSTKSRPQHSGSFSKGKTKPQQKGSGRSFKTNKNRYLHAYK